MAQGFIHLTLPAIALALPQASILLRVMRGALIETARQDYIRTARAKGLSRDQALWRHGFANALIPVLTILGMQLSFLIAGAIIIENVFASRARTPHRPSHQPTRPHPSRSHHLAHGSLVISVSFLTRFTLRGHRSTLKETAPMKRGQYQIIIGGTLLGVIILTGLLSLIWTPADPLAMAIDQRMQMPSAGAWLGTDHFGRDILARLMAATR